MIAEMFAARLRLALVFTAVFWSGLVSGQTNQPAQSNAPAYGSYAIVQRSPNSRVWQRALLTTNSFGDTITNFQSYTELATGVCYVTNGEYADTVEQVVSVPGGAQAVQGPHQVRWALNANTPGGAVTVATPDAKQLLSTVFGLAWYDTATGSNATVATLKDCNGAIAAPNQVVYADAFSNLTADIVYTYTKAGLSQDIVLRQSPTSPSAYGLSNASSVLQIYTEFIAPPAPNITAVTNGNVVDDQLLDFGEMKMGWATRCLLMARTLQSSLEWSGSNGFRPTAGPF